MTIIHIPRRFTQAAWGGTEQLLTESIQLERAAGFHSAIFRALL